MIRTSVILVCFLVGFVCTLVVAVPVRVVWTQLDQRLELPVQPAALNGNLWAGQASLRVADDVLNLHWRWQPAALLQGRLLYHVDLLADATDLRLATHVSLTGQRRVSADGRLSLHLLTPLLAANNVRLNGLLQAENLALVWQPGNPESVSGQGRLTRLALTFPGLDGAPVTRAPQDARLRLGQNADAGELTADLVRAPDGSSLVEVRWPPRARMLVRVLASVRDWLDVELPGGRRVLAETEWPAAGYLP